MTPAQKAKKNYLLRFDELNRLEADVVGGSFFLEGEEEARRKFDECLFWFFVDGYSSGILMLDEDGLIAGKDGSIENMPNGYEFLDVTYPDGKTVGDKFTEHYRNMDSLRMAVLLESEAHRMYNTGSTMSAQDTIKTYGKKGIDLNVQKTWHTMGDERVRDEHWVLEGQTIPFNEEFVTSDGDYGMAPGKFQTAENNANCRCWLTYKRG